jgi:hypothetical protein
MSGQCTTSLNMERVALPSSRITHLPYNAALCGSILDLVFLPIYQGYTANLTIGARASPIPSHYSLMSP